MARVEVRCTDSELEQIRAAAEAVEMTVSEYVRMTALGGAGLDPAFKEAVSDHEARLTELEAWHARSKRMKDEYERRGWQNPLENPDAEAMYFKRRLGTAIEPIERDEDAPVVDEIRARPLPKIAPRR